MPPKDFCRVNLGCGQSPTPGWLNYDASPSVLFAKVPFARRIANVLAALDILSDQQAAYICFCSTANIAYGNALKRLPLKSGSCSVIYASHVLEHLEHGEEASRFLREVHRLLRPSGVLRLAVPDLELLVHQYSIQRDANAFAHRLHVFPGQSRSPLRRLLDLWNQSRHLHRWVYDRHSLSRLLEAEGFVEPKAFPAGETGIENPGSLNLRERAWESLYIEAIKP